MIGMNEIKNAIKRLESSNRLLIQNIESIKNQMSLTNCGRYYNRLKNCEEEYKAVELAVQVLKVELKKEHGCKYCTSSNGEGTDIFDGNQLSVGYGVYREIKYCPICGRRLEGENENTNRRGTTRNSRIDT